MRSGSPVRRTAALALLGGAALLLGRAVLGARLEPADLAFCNGAEPASLDPAVVTGVPEGRVARALFEGLYVKHPETLAPLPGVATSHEVSEDGLLWTFRLRADARWSNGDPVTARDFELSWMRLLDPETASENAALLACVAGARESARVDPRALCAPEVDGAWLRPAGPGRVRVGWTASPGERPAPARAVGDAVERGAVLARGAVPLRAPVDGRVVALNDSAGPTERASPWADDAWIAELAVAPGAVEELRARGLLVTGAAWRRDVHWPARAGVRALDARTLEVRLTAPAPWLAELVSCHPLYPVHLASIAAARERWPDAWQIEWLRPEHLVTNGPYRVAERRVNDRIRLVKSPTYWDADSVALDTIDVLAVESGTTALNLYLAGEAAWIDRVPPAAAHRLVGREDFRPVPYLGTYFYRVNATRPPFDDPRVRRALALAIDRRAICERVTKTGQLPSFSLVPPLSGYPGAELERSRAADPDVALAEDVARARALLAEAGFGPGGRPFPPFELHYHTSESHRDVAEVVADGWRRWLGVRAELRSQEWKVFLARQRALDYDVSRSSWIADYSDPRSFLAVFTSEDENNRTGWSDAAFDALVARAERELDGDARLALLARAEARLLEECPVLPIYAYVTQTVHDPRLGGFAQNALDEHFPKHWYWKDDAELARDRAREPDGLRLAPSAGPRAGKYPPRGRP